ncbi:aminotransferase class I/II-fold pyridoxal phosphate-dependent enzyme [Virgibacillus xinjiangensis]|uniref:Aminotransferase n=1 Tax=Virgibacillus xinjiangensis TaxID=393090 RepID=A0ABV7CY30_9BACI
MAFISRRVASLPAYLFSEFARKKKELQDKGHDIIDLGIGAPDLAPPVFIRERLIEELQHPENHRYSPYSGCKEFKEAVASFYERHYQVELDPEKEVLALIGSKEGIAHVMQAVIDPGEKVIVPDPGYPVYAKGIHLAGGKAVCLPLDSRRGYIPCFDRIAPGDAERSKLMLLNYPGNPTAATVEYDIFKQAITYAEKHDLAVVNDAAYDLVTFGDYQAPSILQVPGSKERAVEFGSLSKSFSMAGWRIGYAVGNREIIEGLSTLKSNMDTSQFLPIQKAAAEALNGGLESVEENNRMYERRMETMHAGLQEIGIKAEKPRGTLFLWAEVPEGCGSQAFADMLLEEIGVLVTPGSAFGKEGEGYFRIALTVPVERLNEVIRRWKKLGTGGD